MVLIRAGAWKDFLGLVEVLLQARAGALLVSQTSRELTLGLVSDALN